MSDMTPERKYADADVDAMKAAYLERWDEIIAQAAEITRLRTRIEAADRLAEAVEYEVKRSRRHLAAGTFAALSAYKEAGK